MSLTSLLMESGSGETLTTVRDSELTSKTRFSNFGDGDCGEPFTPQHLQLDFTPSPEVDTASEEQKIIDFWDFVNNTPEIQHLMVMPENQPSLMPQRTEVPVSSPPESKPNKEKNLEMDQSAISSLEIYSEPSSKTTSKVRRPQKNSTKVKKLCKILQEWDEKHPKSMEPPGLPPALDQYIDQRQSSKQKRPVESSAGTSNPKSPETFSVFSDGSCGEPLEPQHLTIDFTPNEEMDTEFVQKKVCSFWQFIENSPEIHNLRVNADRNIILETDSSSGNLINRIFGAKMPSTQCSLGPRPSTSSPSVPCPQNASDVPNKKPSKATGSELSLLSRQLNDWDTKHFK
ncbi:hypothetical protein HW555_010525 [Spodoptera exigua]|uniref:Uncharacterized protein n=1 Tax=Spodoptera exigua TaxID=7107 RepID=A0A835GAM2_SPOEX|nr:hypothetical protein HW555_010525 [Spodoptera exigua]